MSANELKKTLIVFGLLTSSQLAFSVIQRKRAVISKIDEA